MKWLLPLIKNKVKWSANPHSQYTKETVTAYVLTAIYYDMIGEEIESMGFMCQAQLIDDFRQYNILKRN
jgi:hypothetical protein